MASCIKSLLVCGSPKKNNDGDSSDDEFDETSNSLMWFRDTERHSCGEFSYAVIQANNVMEDQSQVETGLNAIFAGVYDGHAGPEAAIFIKEHLFHHLINITQEIGTFSNDVLRGAIAATENEFLAHAERTHKTNPSVAITGSCCLVGVIWKGTLYVANVGDSSAVIFSVEHNRSDKIIPEQLTTDHNVSNEAIRKELMALHPEDQNIVLKKNDAWRVKGIIQVSRSIGDAYLKWTGFTLDPSLPEKYHLPEPISKAVLTAEPSVYSRALNPNDRFIIFASDGLWELVTKDMAVEIVHKHPRNGIAKRLIKEALKVVLKSSGMKFRDLQKFMKGDRRPLHDDITVIVIYLDHQLLGEKATNVPELSFKSFIDSAGPSEFRDIQNLM